MKKRCRIRYTSSTTRPSAALSCRSVPVTPATESKASGISANEKLPHATCSAARAPSAAAAGMPAGPGGTVPRSASWR